MRLSEIASMNFGLTPSLSATACPRSTSKPSTLPDFGLLKPKGGTSYLTPITISPFSWMSPSGVPASNFSTSAAGVEVASPPLPEPDSSSSPQPASTSPSTSASTASHRVVFIALSLSLVVDDLVDEVACAVALGRLEELLGGALLDDVAVVDEDDPVADLAREPHLVGHDGHRHAVAREIAHDVEHLPDHLRVERGRGLVEQHEFGVHGQRAGDRDALLLAAGEVGREGVRLLGQPDALQQPVGPLAGGRLLQPLHLDRRHGQVLHDGLVGEQVELLEHHPDLRAHAVDVLACAGERGAVEAHVALVDPLEPVDAAQHGRLAGARGAGDDHDLPAVDRQIDPVQHQVVAEALSYSLEFDEMPHPRAHLMRAHTIGRWGGAVVTHALSGAPTTVRRSMRLIVARCSVEYSGRLSARLPEALRLVMLKADGSVLVHADAGGYKPLNWMTPPTVVEEEAGRIVVRKLKGEDRLDIVLADVLSDVTHTMDEDAARLEKDGVEAHLQELLADAPGWCGEGFRLVRREWPTDIGPVDLMCREAEDGWVAVEIKRVGTIEVVKPQARVLAEARGLDWVEVDLAELRGERAPALTLFG